MTTFATTILPAILALPLAGTVLTLVVPERAVEGKGPAANDEATQDPESARACDDLRAFVGIAGRERAARCRPWQGPSRLERWGGTRNDVVGADLPDETGRAGR